MMSRYSKYKLRIITGVLAIIVLLSATSSIISFGKKDEIEKENDLPIVDSETIIAPLVIMDASSTMTKSYKYIEVVSSCGIHFVGNCVNMRSGPGKEYPIVLGLRNGIVLKVEKSAMDNEGMEWYKIQPDRYLLFPERIKGDLYVAASVVNEFGDEGEIIKIDDSNLPITKRIVVDLSEQMLYAYDGDTLFMQQPVSTGLHDTPTDIGNFTIYKKTPSRYMQGPLSALITQYYDLPGVPWNMYFTYDGSVIHGAYWHDSFGKRWSHGCVNMPPEKAKELYRWAIVGTPVTVQE